MHDADLMARDAEIITLVLPIYNEEQVLPALIEEIQAFRIARSERIRILFVDDGSTDSSSVIIKALGGKMEDVKMIRFSRNFGHQLAVTAGLHNIQVDSSAAIVMDADLQDPLEVAGQMIDKWKEGYDVVYGIRRERAGVSIATRSMYRVFYRLFSGISEVSAPEDAGDFRLLSSRVIHAYKEFGEQQPYVRGLVAWLGFDQTGIEYNRPARAAGTSKYSWSRLFQLGFDGLTSFSSRPLRYAMKIGIFISVLSVLGLVWALVEKLILETNLPGWASLVFIGFFFGGLQLFFLGIVGSYVARVYEEVKGRPRFVIQQEWDSSSGSNTD